MTILSADDEAEPHKTGVCKQGQMWRDIEKNIVSCEIESISIPWSGYDKVLSCVGRMVEEGIS